MTELNEVEGSSLSRAVPAELLIPKFLKIDIHVVESWNAISPLNFKNSWLLALSCSLGYTCFVQNMH